MRRAFGGFRVPVALAFAVVLAGAPAPASAQEVPAEVADALAMAAAGDLSGAIAAIEAFCAAGDAPDAAFAALGALHVEAGNPERALDVLQPLVDREPADAGVLYNAGRAAEALGRPEEAANRYRQSLAIQPRSPALRALGMMLGRHGFPAEAYAFLQPWTNANPNDLDARVAAAAGAIALERAPEAEALLEGLPGDDPGVKMLRAQLLLQQADPWGAIAELQGVADDPPPTIEGGIRRTLARAYLVVGEAEGALEQLAPLDAAGPEDAVLRASAWFQAGRMEEAIETLAPFAEPLLNSPPPEAPPPVARDIVLEYGRYLHSSGDAARAVPFLRLATELDAGRPDAYQALGQALAASGEREEARDVLERFQELSRDASDEVASVNRRRNDIADPTGREVRQALELAAAGEVEAALGILAREAQLASTDPRPVYAASAILLDAGRNEEALAAADRALATAPGRADSLYQRGAVLMALDRLDDAEAMFRRALRDQPGHTATLSDFAVLLMSTDRDAEALEHVERLLEVRPDDPLARRHIERLRAEPSGGAGEAEPDWARLGREEMSARNFHAAEEPLRLAVSLDPADASLRLDFASTLWENNKPREAELQAREAVALLPSSAGAQRLLGGLLLWRGAHAEAAEALERAAELAEPDAALLIELGRAWEGAAGEAESAEERDSLARAESAFRRAVTLAPEHSEAAYGLAQVLRRLGREEEAAAAMERYRELYRGDQEAARENGVAAAEPPVDG